MAKHENNGNCVKCDEIFNLYAGFSDALRSWFKALQHCHPELHISCAGRGHVDQEAAFKRGASNAHYGQSAHNYNAAIDTFRLLDGKYDLNEDWYNQVISPNLTSWLTWYGDPDADYYERPHIEISNWKEMREKGLIKLVE